MTRRAFIPRLEIFECEGHGRYFEVTDSGEYVGTYERDASICEAFGGRIALVYGYAAYEARCARIIEQHPYDFDMQPEWDDNPEPFLVRVKRSEEL